MLSQRHIDCIVYCYFTLGESLESIIQRHTFSQFRETAKGSKYRFLKKNSFSIMKQITYAINKRRVYLSPKRFIEVDSFCQKEEPYYDNEDLYGDTNMIESLKDGSVYDITKLTYEDVVGELPKKTKLSSYRDIFEYATINVEHIPPLDNP